MAAKNDIDQYPFKQSASQYICSMNEISIREATKEDAGLIADLSRQTFYDTFAAENTAENMDKFMNETFTREKLMAEVGAGGNTFLLAYQGDEVLGYVRLRETGRECRQRMSWEARFLVA